MVGGARRIDPEKARDAHCRFAAPRERLRIRVRRLRRREFRRHEQQRYDDRRAPHHSTVTLFARFRG
jgi:hypothetical protein